MAHRQDLREQTWPDHQGPRSGRDRLSVILQSWVDVWRRLIGHWIDTGDRARIFTDAATIATGVGVAYWLVLALAGTIASLGLALDSAAVIIGAMLIAPLLAPVVGLALALAVGDGGLAVETGVIVLLSTIVVIGVGMLLAIALPLPFQAVTAEIAARTRPTTLDLAIAVASGLAGAAVTVAPRSRLSGAVPGVAISVALVPPLAVAGFGIGTGWDWPIIRGSLLLYGANLAGIVMSGMVVFLLAGMHRPDVRAADREWCATREAGPIGGWVARTPGLRSLGTLERVWTRVALVAAFVALVAIPLRESLHQIVRESRVNAAIDEATQRFVQAGHSFVVGRSVDLGPTGTRVILTVATTGWFDDSARRGFEQRASIAAGEPIALVLEQLPASAGDAVSFAAMFGIRSRAAGPRAVTPAGEAGLIARVAALRDAMRAALTKIDLPDSVIAIDYELVIGDVGTVPTARIAYASATPIARQAQSMIERQLRRAVGVDSLTVKLVHVTSEPYALGSSRRADAAVLDSASRLLARYPRLRAVVTAGARGTSDRVARDRAEVAAARLHADRSRIFVINDSTTRALTLRLVPR